MKTVLRVGGVYRKVPRSRGHSYESWNGAEFRITKLPEPGHGGYPVADCECLVIPPGQQGGVYKVGCHWRFGVDWVEDECVCISESLFQRPLIRN